jgi:hypothetical protein
VTIVLQLDKRFVRHWSDRYMNEELGDRELRLFSEIGPVVARRGYLTPVDLAEIGKWKTRRAKSYLARNDPAQVEGITQVAFAPDTPEWLRHRILCLLAGVGQPMASAVLTVWRPDGNTVLDYRAVEALRELAQRGAHEATSLGGRGGALPDYWSYLQVCRSITRRLDVNYRDLDRGLWKWNKAGMPER